METKKYYFQNMEFSAKEITLEVLTNTFQLKKRWEKHLATYTKNSWIEIRKVIARIKGNKEKNKIQKILDSIVEKIEKEEIQEAFQLLAEMENDSQIVIELKEALTNLTLTFSDALELFLLDKNNLKELFENALSGETEKIDYSVNEPLKLATLNEFAINIFSDFFLPQKRAKSKLKL